MRETLSLIVVLISLGQKLQAQTAIDVMENTLKISGLSEESFYYGFAEGDQIIFNFEEVNGKELKEIEILEHPSSSKFMDYKSKKIINKTLNIHQTGIYKFRFSNSALAGRICRIKLQRIPAGEQTKGFNTSVFWRTVHDTTISYVKERYLAKADTLIQEVYSSAVQVSSQTAINGNKNRVVVDFAIPSNAISWSFYIGTGKEGKQEYDNGIEKFTEDAKAIVSSIPNYGPMAVLALTGASYFNKVQGEDNVKYWFLQDENSLQLFQSNQPFYAYKMGDVTNEASQMKSPLEGKIYLALLNDNTIDPISLVIKVVVIQVNQVWDYRTVKKIDVLSRQEPFLK